MPLDTSKERIDISMAEFLAQMNMAVDNGKVVGEIAERNKIADWLQDVLRHPNKPTSKWIIDKIRAGVDGEA
jgi:hypothetical protein